MSQFIQSAGSLAAACTILGVAFLWFFRTRHWVHGDNPAPYSALLAGFVRLVFTTAPLILWAGSAEADRAWTLPEAATATVVTGLLLSWHTAAARKAFTARLVRQRRI